MPLNSQNLSDLLHKADRVIIGAGAGLNAAAGLDYTDPETFAALFQPFLKEESRTISEAMAAHWRLCEASAADYWGYLANHIWNIYYRTEQLDTYKHLYNAVKDSQYFVITTNADGQFLKGCFDTDRVFSPQGSYGRFQCSEACHDTLYDNCGND